MSSEVMPVPRDQRQRRRFDVGGVPLDRPFKIRRLGHIGFNCTNIDEALHFYRDLLGFRISDIRDDTKRLTAAQIAEVGDTRGFFMRYNTDHHSFVLYNKRVRDLMDAQRAMRPGVTINQISWQVGSLAEVANADDWFRATGQKMRRSGRDMPGSNWHTYLFDPDGHVNELYYGMEQVGWDGHTKPRYFYGRDFKVRPPLPQISEQQEVQDALAEGVDLADGSRFVDDLPATYDVDGILLPRPFKIVRHGPVNLFVEDLAQAEEFYRDVLGFALTEEVTYAGHRCLFLRGNLEHHSVSLVPLALRETLELSPHSTCMSLGIQVANYRQLRDAVAFLVGHGCDLVRIPKELTPGMDYVAHVRDPDGHLLQLYYRMDHVPPAPPPAPEGVEYENWPETLADAPSDVYGGETFLGPWG